VTNVAEVRAVRDPQLVGRVVGRRALRYSAGADPGADRPAHVRSGSGLAWAGARLAVVQDDAAFLALVDPSTWEVEAVALPRGPGGLRQFDDVRGNKRHKLDLEAILSLEDGRLVAFGSGSSPARERVVVVDPRSPGDARVRVVGAPALYAALRADPRFSGSELNVEGAVLLPDRLLLLQRGNGAPRGEQAPCDAVGVLDRAVLEALVAGHEAGSPRLRAVTRYVLGTARGVRLGFTDAAPLPGGGFAFLAAAEASPDAVRDGEVVGTALGVVTDDGARIGALVDEAGAPLLDKVEGLALDPREPGRAWVVVDADDPHRASELCELAVSGWAAAH